MYTDVAVHYLYLAFYLESRECVKPQNGQKTESAVLPYSGNAAVIYLYFKLLEYAAGCAEAIINRGSFRSSSESRLQNIFVTG